MINTFKSSLLGALMAMAIGGVELRNSAYDQTNTRNWSKAKPKSKANSLTNFQPFNTDMRKATTTKKFLGFRKVRGFDAKGNSCWVKP